MIVPLEVRGKILGAVGFSYAESDCHYSNAHLPLAQELARRAAIAIENARLYRQLQDADRRKDEFLAMLAHELRNPLAAISGARSLLDAILEGEAKTLTGTPRAILERQTSHLARLVDDLMDVSRITRGKIELRRQTVDFNEIIRSALDGVRPLILSRRHDLSIDLPPEAVQVNADPARLGQIVSNLVTNAAKYTDPGGQIFVSLSTKDSDAVLRVRDNGTGLRPDMIGSIWDLFVQNDRTLDRSQGGLGIGLTLVKSLAEMHGGRVGVHSEGLGKGSEFWVAIPRLKLVIEGATQDSIQAIEPVQEPKKQER
jgi:signal transduction histidine kinase